MALPETAQEYPATEHCLGEVAHFDDAPQWIYELDNPYLHGAYAPTLDELQVEDLPVLGELPDDLVGAYFRNGPNPVHQPKNRYHPFDGDGMVHGVYFRDGKVELPQSLCPDSRSDPGDWRTGICVARGHGPLRLQHVPVRHQGHVQHRPVLVRGRPDDPVVQRWPSLSPGQRNTGNQRLFTSCRADSQRRMSAHSKVDWSTGELLFFDYGDEPPFHDLRCGRSQGRLQHEVAIDLPGPRLPHDIGFTTHYAILHDLPFFPRHGRAAPAQAARAHVSQGYTHPLRHHPAPGAGQRGALV